MKNQILKYMILALSTLFHTGNMFGQCANNLGFETGNFTSWRTATDSLFIQPANRVYTNPGSNMRVVNYGATDAWLGTISPPNGTVGSRLVRVGNRGVRAVADTVYRTYIVDSLSDKLTIYSMGVSELAHNFWGVPVNEAPGFGYEIFVNGRRIDCLRGSFFCGNLDQPPVWQLGTFRDTATVRKSTGWGAETLNFACFVGDTVEIRLFTRDCILLGHYAYAYFDVVCGDTSKPVFSQIQINDMIADDELDLYCVPGATLFLEPQTEVCPIFMGNLIWTPAQHIVGPSNLDSAIINVVDSAWIYVQAEFSNYCLTITVIDSVYVRKLNADPHDNIPRPTRNFCDCKNDTIDFTGVDVNLIYDDDAMSYTLVDEKLIVNPCDKFYHTAFWKSPSTQTTINGSAIGATSWSSGNNRGAIGVDSILPGGTVRYVITPTAGKIFHAGINDVNSSFNNDMDHSIRVDGTNIRAYYGGSSQANLGTFTGTVTVDFVVLSTRRVRIFINGVLVHSYTNAQRANTPVFADYSGQSNHNPHINAAYVLGPTTNIKDFAKLINPAPFNYYLNFTDRCGVTVLDTMRFIPGFTLNTTPDEIQCGLQTLTLNVTSNSLIENISWTSLNTSGSFFAPGNVTPSYNQPLNYTPTASDYNVVPMRVFVTARSGRCTARDTANILIHEIPSADAGPDITTTLDTFAIGGSPSGACGTCGSFNMRWSQGSALSDSTVSNPDVYKNQIGAPFFVVNVMDPITGCFALDTVEVFTSLANGSNFMDNRCISQKQVELSWVMLPDAGISQFVVEYSLDLGRSWSLVSRIEASKLMTQTPVSYKLTIDKQQNTQAIYRWYAVGPTGTKSHMQMLNDLSCHQGTVYTLYPNPFKESIEVQVESNSVVKSEYQVQIVNQFGQVVHQRMVSNIEASTSARFRVEDLKDLSVGIYYLNIKHMDQILYKTLVVKSE